MTDVTQSLPLELLIGILSHVSVPDVVSVKQVNRAFRDAILASPLIQLKIDLFAAGLEYNAAAGIDLAESRKALLRYSSSLNSLRPIEKRMVTEIRAENQYRSNTAGGVHAVFIDSIRLRFLGSASRGIPSKEWKIPSPIDTPVHFYLYPGANLITFVEWRQHAGFTQIVIHLRALSDGEHHPVAQSPTIQYSRADLPWFFLHWVSITDSRLAMLVNLNRGRVLVIWDWKSAQLLFESERESYYSIEFIDDYQLLAASWSTPGSPPSFVLINTEDVGGSPTQTTLHLPLQFGDPELFLHLEEGVHGPSPEESLAPFYPDPLQRIVILEMKMRRRIRRLVVTVGALLELERRGEAEIGWDEWKCHVAILRNFPDHPTSFWVSGCRLFYICSTEPGPGPQMQVYDLSPRGRAQYLGEEADRWLGVVRYLSPTPARAQIPRVELDYIFSGHDSIGFSYWADVEGASDDQYNMHVWMF